MSCGHLQVKINEYILHRSIQNYRPRVICVPDTNRDLSHLKSPPPVDINIVNLQYVLLLPYLSEIYIIYYFVNGRENTYSFFIRTNRL